MGTPSGQLSTEQIISAVARLSLPELEQVFNQVLALQAARKAAHVSAGAAALLARLNQSLPAALRERLACLRAKRADASIPDAEYEALKERAGVSIPTILMRLTWDCSSYGTC
jgi:hypothetical protein